MAESILIRYTPEDPDRFQWMLTDGKGTLLGGVVQGPAEELAAAAKKRHSILLIPGADLLLTEANLPIRNASGIVKALPYALEEQLADDVDALCFGRGPQDETGNIPVAIIRRERLEAYLEPLEALGIHPDRAYPAPLLLPLEEDAWSLVLEEGKALLRTGAYRGLELETETLAALLPGLLEELPGEERPKLKIWHCGDPEGEAKAFDPDGFEVETMYSASSGMTLMSLPEKGLDLMLGMERPGDAATSLKSWLPAAALLVLAFLVEFGVTGYDYWQLADREQALKSETETLFRETFPEVRRIVDIKAQTDQGLKELRGKYGQGTDLFLSLLHTSGKALRKDKALEMTGMSFKNGILQLRLKGNDLSQFEALKQRIAKGRDRLDIKILSAVSRKDEVEARLQIREQKS